MSENEQPAFDLDFAGDEEGFTADSEFEYRFPFEAKIKEAA